MFILILFSSSTDLTCWYDEVKVVLNISLILKYFVVKFVFILKEIGSDTSSTIHKVSFKL